MKKIRNYTLHEAIGAGQFGKVYRGTNETTSDVVAIKVMNMQKFNEVPKLTTFIKNEIKILSKISHPNVIKFYEMFKTSSDYYLIYEYCSNGTLEDMLKKSPKHCLTESKALSIFKQILSAFKALVKENILHRDLKPSNLLVHSNGDIKVADFGFCKALCNCDDLTRTMVGSPVYMAPEILTQQKYSIKADIWSMGVCLFELLFGYCPFEAKNIAALISQIKRTELKIPFHINSISSSTEKLLKSMLVVDYKKRIEWEQLWNYFEKDNSPHDLKEKIPLKEIQNIEYQNKMKQDIKAKLQQNNKEKHNETKQILSNKIYKNLSSNNLNCHQQFKINRQLTLQTLQDYKPNYNQNALPQLYKNIVSPTIIMKHQRNSSGRNWNQQEENGLKSRPSSKGRLANNNKIPEKYQFKKRNPSSIKANNFR